MKARLMDWGLSMYGGYYATVIVTHNDGKDEIIGLHTELYMELKKELEQYNLKAKTNKRIDH